MRQILFVSFYYFLTLGLKLPKLNPFHLFSTFAENLKMKNQSKPSGSSQPLILTKKSNLEESSMPEQLGLIESISQMITQKPKENVSSFA